MGPTVAMTRSSTWCSVSSLVLLTLVVMSRLQLVVRLTSLILCSVKALPKSVVLVIAPLSTPVAADQLQPLPSKCLLFGIDILFAVYHLIESVKDFIETGLHVLLSEVECLVQ